MEEEGKLKDQLSTAIEITENHQWEEIWPIERSFVNAYTPIPTVETNIITDKKLWRFELLKMSKALSWDCSP